MPVVNMLQQMIVLFGVAPADCKQTFFGLIPWYQYLPVDSSCNITFTVLDPNKPSSIPLILLAIVDDLLRVAGMVAIGFVIYAGVQFITSQGNPDQAAKAQSTAINALIGLGIAITAIVFVSWLGSTLT